MLAPKHVLLTGASGFVGQPLLGALDRASYVVRVAARRPLSLGKSIDVVTVPDFVNSIDWEPILRGINIVIHVAGFAHADNPDEGYTARVNTRTTEELARAAMRAGVERFLFISSVRAQTGISAPRIISEQDEARPTDTYGRSKLAAELAVQASGVPFITLRPVGVFGPHVKGNLGLLFRLASSPIPLPIAGFTARRSILGIDNLISAILFVLNNSSTIGKTFLVADQDPLTIGDLVAMLRSVQQRQPQLFYIPPSLARLVLNLMGKGNMWSRLAGELVVDTSKLQSLGWSPPVKTVDGIRSMISERLLY
jgi:nucleoside-diphosphate-sugar epimerase